MNTTSSASVPFLGFPKTSRPLLFLAGLVLVLIGPWSAVPTLLAGLPRSNGIPEVTASGVERLVEREVMVPINVGAWRTAKLLAVEPTGEMKPTKLLVAEGRGLVMTTKVYVYPAGEKRPERECSWGMGSAGTEFFHPKPDGFLQPGKPYTVEVEVILFEVHDPDANERFWMPGQKDKILWRKTFHATPEEKPQLPEKLQKEMEGGPLLPARAR